MKDELYKKLDMVADAITEAAMNKNSKQFGRMKIVNRIRNGKVQMRVVKSAVGGFKVVNGNLVRMSPLELRNRKRGAKISARKRKTEMAKILRNRKLSLQKRKARLG